MKFGSWTYDGWRLDLRLSGDEGGDLSSYIPSGEWLLMEGQYYMWEWAQPTARYTESAAI